MAPLQCGSRDSRTLVTPTIKNRLPLLGKAEPNKLWKGLERVKSRTWRAFVDVPEERLTEGVLRQA